MTLSAPTRLNRIRSVRPVRPANTTTPAATSQVVLMVDFSSPEGRAWWAVGVGDTLPDAIAFAQDSCPTDATWQPTRWNELYGD
jgi:hypothetical protein